MYAAPVTELAPPLGFPTQDALLAFASVTEFWAALASDDDGATRALLFEATRKRLDWPVEGLAAAVRDRLALTREDCRTMGVSTTLRVLTDGSWAFLSVKTDGTIQVYAEPTIVEGKAWTVVRGPSGWQLWGMPDVFELADAQLIQLPVTSTIRPPTTSRHD